MNVLRVRLVVDTGMGSLCWSREQGREFVKEKGGKREEEIINEGERYLIMPGQAWG
jgi:Uncharacterized protein conserved in bacteria